MGRDSVVRMAGGGRKGSSMAAVWLREECVGGCCYRAMVSTDGFLKDERRPPHTKLNR